MRVGGQFCSSAYTRPSSRLGDDRANRRFDAARCSDSRLQPFGRPDEASSDRGAAARLFTHLIARRVRRVLQSQSCLFDCSSRRAPRSCLSSRVDTNIDVRRGLRDESPTFFGSISRSAACKSTKRLIATAAGGLKLFDGAEPRRKACDWRARTSIVSRERRRAVGLCERYGTRRASAARAARKTRS